MNKETILTRDENVTYQTIDGESILVVPNSGKFFTLNQVGSELWGMLDGQKTIADHATIIANKYQIELDTAINDILKLAQHLKSENLINLQ
ncbi:MAG TPA: PqqD family protein [Anaerolineae bacterium]|nr:PqqD family protein [Anaerolineae bacterium]